MNVRIVLLLAAVLALAGAEKRTQVPVRSRLELFKGSGQWQEARFDYGLPLDHTAIVVCDMWDKHWCRGASQRVGEMVPKANAFLKQARAAGLLIVHAPSETMDFYKSAPQRLAFLLEFAQRALVAAAARHVGDGADDRPDQDDEHQADAYGVGIHCPVFPLSSRRGGS